MSGRVMWTENASEVLYDKHMQLLGWGLHCNIIFQRQKETEAEDRDPHHRPAITTGTLEKNDIFISSKSQCSHLYKEIIVFSFK